MKLFLLALVLTAIACHHHSDDLDVPRQARVFAANTWSDVVSVQCGTCTLGAGDLTDNSGRVSCVVITGKEKPEAHLVVCDSIATMPCVVDGTWEDQHVRSKP